MKSAIHPESAIQNPHRTDAKWGRSDFPVRLMDVVGFSVPTAKNGLSGPSRGIRDFGPVSGESGRRLRGILSGGIDRRARPGDGAPDHQTVPAKVQAG